MPKLLVESSLILGVLVIILLLYYRKRSINNSNVLLAVNIACITYLLFINHLNYSREMLNYPIFARTGNISGFLVLPFLYLYSRNTFYPGVRWRKVDWLIFVPAVFYIIDFMPFFLADPEYKSAVMKANLDDPSRMTRVGEGWIPFKGIHYVIMYFWSIAFMILQLRLIVRNKHMGRERESSMNRTLFWFIVTLTGFHIPLIFPGIFGLIFQLKWYSIGYLNWVLATHLITTAVFILFTPKILYGFYPQMVMEDQKPLVDQEENEQSTDVAALNKNSLSSIEIQMMISKIEDYMAESKPYLNKQYTIHNLGDEVGIPVYQLSPIINQHYQSNFNAWVNSYRVNHFIELCKKQKRDVLTLAAIAEESGFNNRSTFISAFKKVTGSTPGNYLKQLQTAS
ncbi:MAG TPA: AraC family transcriptional regulator [Chitinophagaceae bacterium]|nr:AraC family transcriptional regulator [Chitinophagaceae bacterium]